MNKLPIVEFNNLDLRLDEFRNINNPHDRIEIDEAFRLY